MPWLGEVSEISPQPVPPPPEPGVAERLAMSRRHHRLEQEGVDWVQQVEAQLDKVEKDMEGRPHDDVLLRRHRQLSTELRGVPWKKQRFGTTGCSSAECRGECGQALAPF